MPISKKSCPNYGARSVRLKKSAYQKTKPRILCLHVLDVNEMNLQMINFRGKVVGLENNLPILYRRRKV